jgi:predicted nucleic acid-binding protein
MVTKKSDTTYLLDTNVFNDLLDGKMALALVEGRRVIVTGVQKGELMDTRDPGRTAALLTIFEEVEAETVLTASAAWDISGAGWDQACWNDETGRYEKMLARLRALDGEKKTKRKALRANQEKDILIAETALKEGAVLVTGDGNLRTVVIEFGGEAMKTEEFLGGTD